MVIYGASEHAKVVIDVVEQEKKYNIVGIIDPKKPEGTEFVGHMVLGDEEFLKEYIDILNIQGIILAVSDNFSRYTAMKKFNSMSLELNFITAIHPSAIIGKHVEIGEGSVIMPNSVINTGTKIGKHVIINTSSVIEHGNLIDDFADISPSVITGANVKIGGMSIVGLGSKIIHDIKIGNGTLVGAGSLVLKNLPDNVLAYGTPAKTIRHRKASEKLI